MVSQFLFLGVGNLNLFLELFGYLGTALVLISMMMTSVKRLRLVNMTGSVISMIYGILINAWPVALLNLGLIVIHVVKLLQLRGAKEEQ